MNKVYGEPVAYITANYEPVVFMTDGDHIWKLLIVPFDCS
jgi:hypothetical protein